MMSDKPEWENIFRATLHVYVPICSLLGGADFSCTLLITVPEAGLKECSQATDGQTAKLKATPASSLEHAHQKSAQDVFFHFCNQQQADYHTRYYYESNTI